MGRRERGHDSDGRFAGSNRVNVEDVPRLPTFPAAWTLADPRGRPYFVFWTSPHDGTLARVLRMESVQQGAAVQLTIPDAPRDPRAISDPRLILDEFPDLVGDR